MKVTLNTKLFKDCLQDVARVISKSNITEIESYLFKFTKDTLQIVGTNLDSTIVRDITIRDGKDFKCLVTKKINDIVKNLNSDVIDLSFKDSKIVIESDNTKFNLAMQSGEENFPELNLDFSKMQNLTLKNTLLQSVVYAAGTDDLRIMMTGVFIGERNNDLVYCATDGHRLSKITDANEDGYKGDIIIPRKFIDLISKVKENSLTFKVNKNIICLIGRDNNESTYTYYSRLIGENFPNAEAVIPKDYEQGFVVNRYSLLSILKKLYVVLSETRTVKFNLKDSVLSISVENLGNGANASDSIEVKQRGEDIAFGLNIDYIIDLLKNLDCENVMVEYSNAIRPFIFYGALREKEINLIMPVRINE